MIGATVLLDWVLNALLGLGILGLLVVGSYFVLVRRARWEKRLEEADRRYAESEARAEASRVAVVDLTMVDDSTPSLTSRRFGTALVGLGVLLQATAVVWG